MSLTNQTHRSLLSIMRATRPPSERPAFRRPPAKPRTRAKVSRYVRRRPVASSRVHSAEGCCCAALRIMAGTLSAWLVEYVLCRESPMTRSSAFLALIHNKSVVQPQSTKPPQRLLAAAARFWYSLVGLSLQGSQNNYRSFWALTTSTINKWMYEKNPPF